MPLLGNAANDVQRSNVQGTAQDALPTQGTAPGASTLVSIYENALVVAPGGRTATAQAPSSLGADSVAMLAHLTVTPFLGWAVHSLLAGLRTSLAVDANDPVMVMAGKMCMQATLYAGEGIVTMASDALIEKLKDRYNESRAAHIDAPQTTQSDGSTTGGARPPSQTEAERATREQLERATDLAREALNTDVVVQSVVEGMAEIKQQELVQRSPHQWAVMMRPHLVRAVETGVGMALRGVAARLGGWLSTSLLASTPAAAKTAATAFSFALHRQMPLIDVDASTLPEVGGTFPLLCMLETEVLERRQTFPGAYAVKLRVARTLNGDALAGQGELTVRMLDNGFLEGVDDLSALSLAIDRFTLTDLVGSYAQGVGLTITRATMSGDGTESLELKRLAISPFGWVSGAFLRNGRELAFGSHYPKLWPEPVDAAPVDATTDTDIDVDAEPVPPRPEASSGDDANLTRHADSAFRKAAGALSYIASPMLKVANYATGGINLMAPTTHGLLAGVQASQVKPSTTKPSGLGASLANLTGLDPGALLGRVRNVSLVPDALRKRIHIAATELSFGHEPSARFGMELGIVPFPDSAEPDKSSLSAGLIVTWLVDQSPYVLFAAPAIKVGPGSFYGIEADPESGLRVAAAKLVLPLPSIPGVLAIDKLEATGERLTIGKGFGARRLEAALQNIALFDGIVTAESMAIAYSGSSETAHRFEASLTGGKVAIGGGAPQAEFAGKLGWGDGGVTAHGKASLTTPVTLLDALTLEEGTLETTFGQGKFATTIGGAFRLVVQGTTTRVDGRATVDNRGIASVAIVEAKLRRADNTEIFGLDQLTYDRDARRLWVKQMRVDVPQDGSLIRGLPKQGAAKKPSTLILSNVDLSGALPRTAPTEPATEPAPTETDEAALAPKDQPALDPFDLRGDNLEGLELGPPGAPFVKLELLERAPEQTGLAARLTANLGPVHASAERVDVQSDPADRTQITARAAKLAVAVSGDKGAVATIDAIAYAQHQLTITKASLPLGAALAALWPSDLGALNGALTASMLVDTEAGRLASLEAALSLTGHLFGNHIVIDELTGAIKLAGGRVAATGDSALAGGSLAADLSFRGTLGLFGATIHFSKAQLKIANGKVVEATLSAVGQLGGAEIRVNNLRYLGNGQVAFDEVVTHIPRPKDGDVVKFLPPNSSAAVPETDDVVITLRGLGYDTQRGTLLFAEHERIVGDGKPLSDSSAPERVKVMSIANFGGISLADGAVVAQLTENPEVSKVVGRNELVVTGSLGLELGPIAGKVNNVEIFVPLAPAQDANAAPDPNASASPDAPNLAPEAERNARGRIHVGEALLGKNGELRAEELWAQNGVVTIRTLHAKLGRFLGALSPELEAMRDLAVSATDIKITATKQLHIGGIAVDVPGFTAFDGKVQLGASRLAVKPGLIQLGDPSAALLGSDWNAALEVSSASIRPVEGLALSSANARLAIDATGISGRIEQPTLAWTDNLHASAERVELDRGGFQVVNAALGVSPAVLAKLDGLGDVMSALPSWIPRGGDVVIGLRNLNFGYRDGAIQWPALGDLRFGVRRASIALGGFRAGFDLDKGEVLLGVQHRGNISAMAQLPLGQGVGLEIGGALFYDVGIDGTGHVENVNDLLKIKSGLKARASLEATLNVGIYGGVPSVFSASAGLYAGLKLQVLATADIQGAWPLPTRAGDNSGGAIDALFQLKDGMTYPDLTATAGFYVKFNFLGTSRMLRKQMAAMKIAELHAHGGMRMRTGEPIALLPQDRFPAYAIHLDPALREQLFGQDFQAEYQRSQRRLSGKFADVEATEEMLGVDDQHLQGQDAPSWDRPALKKELTEANTAHNDAKKDAAQYEKQESDKLSLRAKLEKERKRYSAEAKALDKYKGTDKGAVWIGARSHAVTRGADGQPRLDGRLPSAEPDAATRLAQRTAERANKKVPLTADELRAKAEQRKQEIAHLAQDVDEAQDAALDHLADTDAAQRKARTKADLAKHDVKHARKQLADSRLKLLESLYVASKVEVRGNDKKLRGDAELKQLADDKAQTERDLAALTGATDADELERGLLAEHIKFLAGEIEFVTAREIKHNYTSGKFDDQLGSDRSAVLSRAATARADKRDELKQRMKDKVLERRMEIEATLRKQNDKIAKLAKVEMSDERRAAKLARYELKLATAKQCLQRYIEVIDRVESLLDEPESLAS